MRIKKGFLLSLLIATAACNPELVRQEAGSENLVEIQRRADAAYQSEDWKAAEENYLALTQKIPADAEYWFRLGNVYARTNRPDEAILAYKEVLVRNPKNSKAWHNLGMVQLRQATNTFIEMVEYTEESDPLNQRARSLVNSMTNLMEAGYSGDQQ